MMKKLLVLLGTVMLLSSTVTQAFCMGASGVSADTYTPGGAYNPSGTSGTQQGEVIDLGHRCAFVGEECRFIVHTSNGAWYDEFLPSGASYVPLFDGTLAGVFTWTPQQGDLGKTYRAIFRYTVAAANMTAEMNISVVDLVKIETGGFTEHISLDEYSGGKKAVWCEAVPSSTKAEVFMYV